jgi:hypothetical protein
MGAIFSMAIQTGRENHSVPCTILTGMFVRIKQPERDADNQYHLGPRYEGVGVTSQGDHGLNFTFTIV